MKNMDRKRKARSHMATENQKHLAKVIHSLPEYS